MPTHESVITPSSNSTLEHDSMGQNTYPPISQKKLAWQDMKEGLLSWRVWLLLAYQDIKLRYRRSVLGPFWITISMAITVYSMGYLYSHLFHMNMNEYFPYLVAGMLGWSLISTIVTEMVETFTSNDGLIKQLKLPYSLHVHRVVAKNMIIFFHNILVFVPVIIFFHSEIKFGFNLLGLIPGLFIIYFNAFCYGMVFAMVGARYRDISQLIKSLIQVIFFVTPVMWKPSILPANKQLIAEYNPVYSLLELIRAPLIGYPLTITNLVMIACISLIGLGLCYYLFIPRRSRIIYWL